MRCMKIAINKPFKIGNLELRHRLIQGPLAGYSCAPMRMMFSAYENPAYAVSEMLSAIDVLRTHEMHSRYLYRSPCEGKLCYQLSGNNPMIMAEAAYKLQEIGADIIDINCGCPMPKIRKKGAGSALMEKPHELFRLIETVRGAIQIPLTVKIRIQAPEKDIYLAQGIEASGADALIVHGRRHVDDYNMPCQYQAIRMIKSSIVIPVIANGDMACWQSLERAYGSSEADAFMISRAGCGKPWIFQDLLTGNMRKQSYTIQLGLFKQHLLALANLEGEYQACLQGRALIRYYLKSFLHELDFGILYQACDLEGFFANL